MSSKPYLAFAATLVADENIPHAGASRLDREEYDALIEGLRTLDATQCRAIMDSPQRAHMLGAALDKIRPILAAPAPVQTVYATTRALILESAAACKLPATDPRALLDAPSAFGFCQGYIRCADDAGLLTEAESRELRQLLRDHHPS